MQTEIEVKFPQIDIDAMRERLKEAGAVCEQPMRLMRRVNMETDYQSKNHAFLRVRDEGDKVTLTYKQRADHEASTIDGTKEIEVEVSDFEKTIEIFRLSDLPPVTYQETRRETWKLGAAEIVIDEWPWIKPFIEIEAPNETLVREAADKLGLDWADVMIRQIDYIYMLEYDFAPDMHALQDIDDIRFELPVSPKLIPKD